MDTVKVIAEIISAFGTLIVGVIVAYIAYQQHKTNRNKLRLDLYDKRFSVYKGLNTLLFHVLRDANVSIEALAEFKSKTHEATFLFDGDIAQYLQDVRAKAVELRSQQQKLDNKNLPVGPDRSKLAEENSQVLQWFEDQLDISKQKFSKYLKFNIRT